MLTVVCPNCNSQLPVDDGLFGKRVRCGKCNESFEVGSPQERIVYPMESNPELQLLDRNSSLSIRTTPVRRSRRKKSVLATATGYSIHLGILAVAITAGYYLFVRISELKKAAQQQAAIESHPAPRRPSLEPRTKTPARENQLSKQRVPSNIENNRKAPETEPLDQSANKTTKNQITSIFHELPEYIELPSNKKATPTSIVENIPHSELSILDGSSSLKLVDDKVIWTDNNDKTEVAALKLEEGKLVFQWHKNVDEDAESALINSVIELTQGKDIHGFMLREPVLLESPKIDLKKSKQRFTLKIPHLPEPKLVHCELTGIEQLPTHTFSGDNPNDLRVNEAVLFQYKNALFTASQVSLKRTGNTVSLILDSRYELPSDGAEPLSFPSGNRKRDDINDLLDQVARARNAIPQLRRDISNLSSRLNSLRHFTPRTYQNEAVIVDQSYQIQQAIAEVESNLNYSRNRLGQANALIQDERYLLEESKELDRVSEIAKQLDGTRFSYRFFIQVGDFEIDLAKTKPIQVDAY